MIYGYVLETRINFHYVDKDVWSQWFLYSNKLYKEKRYVDEALQQITEFNKSAEFRIIPLSYESNA